MDRDGKKAKKSKLGPLLAMGVVLALVGVAARFVLTGRLEQMEAGRMKDAQLEQAIATGHPRFAEALEWAGRLERSGKFHEAAAAYEQAATQDATKREAWKGWARAAYAAHEWKNAGQVMRKTIEVWPDDAEAHFLYAAELNDTFRLTAAAEQLEEGLKHQPTAAAAWRSLGDIRMRKEQYPEAVECYRKAKKLDPKAPELTGLLGWALLRAGNNDEALKDLRAAVDENPMNFDWRFYLGQALGKTGKDADRNEAVKQLNRVTAFSDRKSRGYVEVARIWISIGNASDAIRFLQQALVTNRNDTDALRLMVETQQKQNRPVEAATYQKRLDRLEKLEAGRKQIADAIDHTPDVNTLDAGLVRLGQADLMLGRTLEARLAFQAALSFSPKSKAAQQGLEATAKLEKASASPAAAPK